jgi:hypothetical protein
VLRAARQRDARPSPLHDKKVNAMSFLPIAFQRAFHRPERGWIRAAAIACVSAAVLPALASSNPDRGGIGTMSLQSIGKLSGVHGNSANRAGASTAATTSSVTIDPRRSLIVTDTTIMQSFPILQVLNTLAAGSPNSMIARQLFDQWMDLHNQAPGIGTGGHCNDTMTNGVATVNGFQFDCPRAEGQLVGTNPTVGGANGFMPVALVNRFDLATDPKKGGLDCGEYRIVYSKMSGVTTPTNRMQIIFEGVLPNPHPNGTDLSGCLPVAQFWANLSTISDAATRAQQLHDFYFTGLPGFEPVVKAAHYGFANGPAKGQIRSNLFMQFNWDLREYHLALVNNTLKVQIATDASNPSADLFNEQSTDPRAAQFRSDFLNAVASLAAADVNTFNMNSLPATYNAADSDEQSGTKSNYAAQFANSPNFAAAIQQKLTAIGSTLTPQQIVARAQALTCAGCHQLSNNANLGGGITYPSSVGFVHVDERSWEQAPDGSNRYPISPALTNVFLPHRQAVLQAFLNGG